MKNKKTPLVATISSTKKYLIKQHKKWQVHSPQGFLTDSKKMMLMQGRWFKEEK